MKREAPESLQFVERRKANRDVEHEDFPVGSHVITALQLQAVVIGYRGFRRGHRIWLVCRYLNPPNKRFDKVLLLPELVTMATTPIEGTS